MLKISAVAAVALMAATALPSVTFAQMESGAMGSRSMSMSKGKSGGALHGMANRMKMKKRHHGMMHHGMMHRGMMKKPM